MPASKKRKAAERAASPPPTGRKKAKQAGREAAAAGTLDGELRRGHAIDIPAHCRGEAQPVGFVRQARASIFSPIWTLLAGLASAGGSRSHQLMSV